MITRLVKLTLNPLKTSKFISLFEASQEKIKSYAGCRLLKFYKDVNNPFIYFTYSEWDSEADLENYRNSEVFLSIWKEAKTCFSAPAEAWSISEFNRLDV